MSAFASSVVPFSLISILQLVQVVWISLRFFRSRASRAVSVTMSGQFYLLICLSYFSVAEVYMPQGSHSLQFSSSKGKLLAVTPRSLYAARWAPFVSSCSLYLAQGYLPCRLEQPGIDLHPWN